MKPEVSIVTCMYNAEQYIEETARSVLAQTFSNFEWIIVDDLSSDGSPAIVRRLAAADDRIQVFSLTQRSGPVDARNHAIQRARGRFIAVLDADDLWLPAKLEKQIAYMRERRAPLSYTGYRKIYDNGRLKTGLLVPVPETATYASVLKSDCIMASSAVYDTAITGPIMQSHEAPVGRDDVFFFLSILKKHGPAVGLKDDLARLRVHHDSITGNKLQAARLQWHLYRTIARLPLGKAIASYFIYAVKGLLKYLL